ncbi:ABC transporter ATP-binding protein [Marinomonas sp. BSi20584]|jgi:iron complex transport system ATP-binding protein|uniref:ABC transporter ATP-binding protein n=1 Tax=Marinomonas sp. BSi20584 TaxID=1594462 RepID=UPI000C1EB23D|nr:ABC transporter ATP-binding protein [Marinomonas sp. BSi20584]|tara:strand:+ start:13446 stop:14306 length:861 start_codon:yes stop_codon:yes gene_type:complete
MSLSEHFLVDDNLLAQSPLESVALSLGYDKKTIIKSLDVAIKPNQITVLVGGNGCGKSTLLKSFARLLKPSTGQILLNGADIHSLSGKDVARKLAILPQGPVAPEGLTVEQLVRQGRYPHQNWLQSWTEDDERLVRKALQDTNMTEFADRSIDALSGGQRQRAWIAMALAQNTDILLLDEPTTYLDLTHQIEILDLLFELNATQNTTILMVLHDLNLAARYAHNMIAIKDGTVFCQGAPETILDHDMVKAVFDMECHISADPLFGTPMCIPYGKGRKVDSQAAEHV